MASNQQSQPADVELIPATSAQAPILANLLELYAYDFSDFHNIELGDDGRFGYPKLPLYWTDPNRHAFLVRLNGKLAGLVLVKRGSEVSGDEGVHDIAEFFVIRAYRRRGIGTQIAHATWRRFPGPWEVRVMASNQAACRFWQCAISAFTGGAAPFTRFEKGGEEWRLFRFVTQANS